MDIFELISAPNLATYWTEKTNAEQPYLGEELFPNVKQLGMKLQFLKGKTGAPIALRPSKFDTNVIPRGRKGFEEIIEKLAFFKESHYIDEETRQELLMIQQTGNTAYQDVIMNRVYDDAGDLLRGASVRREIMRMQLLTTGKIVIDEGGEYKEVDYGMPADHKVTAVKSWSDATSDPMADIQAAKDKIAEDTGKTISRMVLNGKTMAQLRNHPKIKATILGNFASQNDVVLSNKKVLDYLKDDFDLSVVVYDKVYQNANGGTVKFVADNTVAFMPAEELGKTVFGTTPEEADLMGQVNGAAVVDVVDMGVAITTTRKTDPVTVETKASMLALPSFEAVETVYVLNTVAQP